MVYSIVYTHANLRRECPGQAGSAEIIPILQPMKPVAAQAEEVVIITHEDVDRAHDRVRVSAARSRRGFSSKARLL